MNEAPVKKLAMIKAEDAWEDPVSYLLSRNWRAVDGHPRAPGTRWLDPTKPDVDKEEKIKIGERKRIGHAFEEVYQVHVTPRGYPQDLADAVASQQARDFAAQAQQAPGAGNGRK